MCYVESWRLSGVDETWRRRTITDHRAGAAWPTDGSTRRRVDPVRSHTPSVTQQVIPIADWVSRGLMACWMRAGLLDTRVCEHTHTPPNHRLTGARHQIPSPSPSRLHHLPRFPTVLPSILPSTQHSSLLFSGFNIVASLPPNTARRARASSDHLAPLFSILALRALCYLQGTSPHHPPPTHSRLLALPPRLPRSPRPHPAIDGSSRWPLWPLASGHPPQTRQRVF